MDPKVDQLLCEARSLGAKFEEGSETRYVDQAIMLDREALDICIPGHPMRARCLSLLSYHLWARYKQLGGIENIDEAISHDREALSLRPSGHPDRSKSLNNLADNIFTRYRELGGVDNIHEAIILDREALSLRPVGHQDRSMTLTNLAMHLCSRYEHLGGVEDLNEGIMLDREALTFRQPGHPYRSLTLTNLSHDLWTRYERLGGIHDLHEAITLDREALTLRPPGNPDRSITLTNLAIHLGGMYVQLHDMEDLEEAITLDREAFLLRPPGHPDRQITLNNLATRLVLRYYQLGGMDDLNQAILLDRDTLVLRSPGSIHRSMTLTNLALHLWIRYKQLGGVEDLQEAIVLDREALALRPPGHPNWSMTLESLATHLSSRYMKLGVEEDRQEVFHLYAELACGMQTVSSSDLSAAKSWVNAAEDFHHPTTTLAYETTFQLLVQHLAALPSLPDHLALLKRLTSSLAVDAFSACLRNQSPIKAVELLEQGRGVFWNQLTRLRSPLDDVISCGPTGRLLADEFIHITSTIRSTLNSASADRHDRVCHLNFELQKVVSSIRELRGLSRFLLPSLFSDLQRAASGGPVIILNASKYGCDALVVSVDSDPVHIPLSVSKQDVRESSSKLRLLIKQGKKMDVTRELTLFLRELWDQVVSPVVDFLRKTYPPRSRVWWCPTAEFSLLPLHAAGPYRKGQQSLSALFVSSYTPTLGALIRARQPSVVKSKPGGRRFIAIGQANASGTSKLQSVGTELSNIGQLVEGLAMFTRIEGDESCISTVTEELRKNQWVHLACHGLPNRKQPFESAFALHDGHLTIKRIIQCDLQNPEFAYLSACHTTVGDEESPDEVIHLASAMQFAGFRSVIGTMWAVDDAETNKITSTFYKYMVDESGCLDHTCAAFALWKTMRTVKIPLDQRILYIHLGA